MIRVTEDEKSGSSRFHVVSEGIEPRVVEVSCVVTRVNNINTYVFYDRDMNVLAEPSCFVTEELRRESENTRLQAVSSMKCLYSFLAIVGLRFQELDKRTVAAFMQFLRGTLSDGVSYSFDLTSVRSEGTVGAYLKHIRRFARHLNCDSSPFLALSRKDYSRGMGSRMGAGYSVSADVKESVKAPKCISIEQYKRILLAIEQIQDENKRLLALCVVRLMFEHGLRLGEALGLTLEDIKSWVDRDGVLDHAVILRNRVTDRRDQHAKTLMNVASAKQYRSSDYKKEGLGFSRVRISQDLYFLIAEYIESSHADIDEVYNCDADAVEKGRASNRYLFINSLGRPLSSNLWNKRLRKIMKSADIPVDSGGKRSNLSHRFRHGYGNYLTYCAKTDSGEPLSSFAIMTLMRHRSLASTVVYTKPTEDQVREYQRVVIGSMERDFFGDSEW